MGALSRTGIACAVVLAASSMAMAQERNNTQPPLITVNGNGQVRMDPDLATVRLGVESQGRTAQEAQSQTNAVSQRLMDAIAKLGIDKKDVQTSSFQLF